MSELIVRRVAFSADSLGQVPELMDQAGIGFQPIACNNWAEAYPYAPEAGFRMAVCGDELLINYVVSESHVRAVCPTDCGRVWEDSCCEFFCSPAADGLYYNVECNCAGRLLVACGPSREGREAAPQAVLRGVRRWSSLVDGVESADSLENQTETAEPTARDNRVFDTREQHEPWQLVLAIPASTFFRHAVRLNAGTRFRANFYKCGDLLPRPHFLSWAPIAAPKPDFHRPECFGSLLVE